MSNKNVMPLLNFLRPGKQTQQCRRENVAGDWAEVGEAVLHPSILEPRISFRYVHHVHRAFVKSDRLGCSFDNSELFHIRGTFPLEHYIPGLVKSLCQSLLVASSLPDQ